MLLAKNDHHLEIKNFLHKNICKYVIDYIDNNINSSEHWNSRKIIKLENKVSDSIIENVRQIYINLRPTQKLLNLELISWDLGGNHAWHDDTIYYNYTTITYLNDNFKGGTTEFKDFVIEPETGKFIGFDSTKLHKVNKLESGKRYVILAWY